MVIGGLVLSILTAFQNCAGGIGGGNQQNSSQSDGVPFAYDSTIDTLSYMSCAGGTSSANPDAIWTFRVGAYGLGTGIHLSDAYMSFTANFGVDQRGVALSQSVVNQNTVLQLSVRRMGTSGDYQVPLVNGSGSGVKGKDFDTILGPLDSPGISSKLGAVDKISNPTRLNYFAGIAGLTGRRMEGTIRFNDSEALATSVRTRLTSENGLLTNTYTDAGDVDTSARGPAGLAKDRVYGRGYKLSFAYAQAADTAPRILSGVDEYNLENNGVTGIDIKKWTCPSQLRYRVGRSCADCPCTNDPSTIAVGSNLDIARRVLRTEHWYINTASMCVVQKETTQQCYPTSTSYHNYVSVCTRTP